MKNSFLNFEIYRWHGHFMITQSRILKSFPQTTHLVFLHLFLSLSLPLQSNCHHYYCWCIFIPLFLVWQTFRITSVLWASLFKCFLNLSKHSSIMCSLTLSLLPLTTQLQQYSWYFYGAKWNICIVKIPNSFYVSAGCPEQFIYFLYFVVYKSGSEKRKYLVWCLFFKGSA